MLWDGGCHFYSVWFKNHHLRKTLIPDCMLNSMGPESACFCSMYLCACVCMYMCACHYRTSRHIGIKAQTTCKSKRAPYQPHHAMYNTLCILCRVVRAPLLCLYILSIPYSATLESNLYAFCFHRAQSCRVPRLPHGSLDSACCLSWQ